VAGDYDSSGHGEGAQLLRCSFNAIEGNKQFRTPRTTPRPVVHGPQTAKVVGKAGKEIWTDEFGRVKVQFHWDREGKSDENSSCWVRVSQVWAGAGWGAMHVPRIGQEVVISFLEGDPDRPLITGRVYNGTNKPPFPLPAKDMKSGIKSDSTPGGGGNNEFSFDDSKGSELVYTNAQWNMTTNVGNDKTLNVTHDRKSTITNDDTEHVIGKQEVTVDKTQTIGVGLDQATTVGATHLLKVTTSSLEDIGAGKELIIGAGYSVDVTGPMSETISAGLTQDVTGAKKVDVSADHTETVGGNKKVGVTGNSTLTAANITATADDAVTIKANGAAMMLSAGTKMNLKATSGVFTLTDDLTIKVGSAEIQMKSNGDIVIKGGKITVKGDSDIKVKGSKVTQNP
jgi:type VI secretion system secreted protein VgrG